MSNTSQTTYSQPNRQTGPRPIGRHPGTRFNGPA